MMTISELQGVWDSIPPYGGGYLRVSGNHPLSFHIGYHVDEQKCFIVLDTGKKEHIASSKAITAECIQTTDQLYALRFSLNYPSLDKIFLKLCWDLIDSSRTAENPVQKIIDQYGKWMRLLQQASGEIMSASLQKGLIGELLYFQSLAKERSLSSALNSWVGPEGCDQDFIFSDSWAEIKAVSIAANEVEISSLQQLDVSDCGFLVIYFMDKVSASGANTISLPEIVSQIRDEFLISRELDEFNIKLVKYGFLDKDLDKYHQTQFRLAEQRTYRVDGTFPRLSRKNIPAAIASAKYGISLPVIETHRVRED